MLCGYLPFDDSNTYILNEKIMNGDFQIPSYISEKAKSLLKGMLNINPD